MRRVAIVPALCALVLLAGCQASVSLDKTFDLKRGDVKVFTVPSVTSARTLTITAKSNEPITVVVGQQKNQSQLEREAYSRKFTAKVSLAAAVKQQDVNLEAQIPANEEAAILILSEATKNATVTLKIKG